tara:strand:+ start:27 stop:902 length:876 start_codon:yes stop_codon:yes gene_type:complete
MEEKFKFENNSNFTLVLIKPKSIDNLDWLDSNYTTNISQLDIYENLIATSDNFINLMHEKLLIERYDRNVEVTTQVITETIDYIFEILYVEGLTNNDNDINDVATLLNTNGEKVYGNAVLMKTYLPSLSKTNLIVDCSQNDIKNILYSRVNTNIVVYDGEWYNSEVSGNLEDFAKTFFDDTFNRCEISFLLHNINIWYENCDGCSKTICGKILEKPIYKCFWFTMINDEFRGNLTLNEVNKIIKISNVFDFPFTPKPEWIEDETDEINRTVIKNKYKILDLAYQKLICQTN